MPLHLGVNPDTGEPIRLPEEDLLRHAVILGATGSGKTVLAKAILEEAVREGVPVIAVDSQGDLASLALAPSQEAAGLHPAPAEVADGYWARAALSIFTPGSSKGSPMSLNPLKPPPSLSTSEDAVLYLDALAQSLAGGMGYDPGSDSGSRAKDAVFVALQSAWKTHRWPEGVDDLARLIERDAEGDGLLSRRERSTLVRRARSMTVGAKGLMFTAGPPLDTGKLLAWAPKGRTPVNIIYTGGARSSSERDLVVATLCEDVYHWMTTNASGALRLLLYIDEVAGLCPPHPKNPPAKKFLSLLFRQARKYGVGLIVATQNVTDLDYKALGQANTWALGRLLARQDLDRVRHLVASLYPTAPDAVMEEIPSLRAGQFILLSPDHLGQAQRLEVRGLASQHMVVPEEKFREIQSSHALAAAAAPALEDERTAKRRKLATAAARAAKAGAKSEVEEGVGLKVLHIFEELPGLYGPEEIHARTNADLRFITILLRKMAEARLLRAERVDGREVYWDPSVGFDLRRGVPERVSTLPLRYPLVAATKRVQENLHRRLLFIPKERLSRKEFYYVPLWHLEAELPLGRKGGRIARAFFVSAVSGEIAHSVGGSLTFEEFPRKDGKHFEPVASKAQLEAAPVKKIGDHVPLAKVGPSQAREIVRRSFGAKVLTEEPELALLPVWKFHVESHEDRKTRPLWVDGTLGTVLRAPPEGL